MLPIPFFNHLPKVYQDNPSETTTAFADKMDSLFESWRDEILALAFLKKTAQCPARYLAEMGYMFGVSFLPTDTEQQKRQKIEDAIPTLKKRGTWENNAKIVIDGITGYDARFWTGWGDSEFIWTGDGVIETGPGIDYAVWGGDGTSPYGMSWIGEFTEFESRGNLYIDCHYGVTSATLTSAQVLSIVAAIQDDIVPAYFRVFLGWVSASNVFTTYTDGIIH